RRIALLVALQVDLEIVRLHRHDHAHRAAHVDAPVNRDSKLLNNSDVWLDRRDLVRVAAGKGGNDADRWYTAGGLLEVGGY
ncbi:hypothetical protein FGX02_00545, partial [Xylella fastidiosa subsp. multiplex]|uniref:hypothetical protein n=1 Tax=Xylella fastidiosa TaxID=2371 RepID=UPI00132BB07C